jgi:hypothetical protein
VKKRLTALGLCCALLLTGCSAMLNRPYSAVVPHAEHPATGEDDSTVQVESYSELVNAVLYFVSQSTPKGLVRLVNYDGDVEDDLSRACLEVTQDDPLGAYAVDFIKTDYTRVLATYEANLYITYRRTPEQIRSLVSVTGASAIRAELGDALADFQPELALRVGYFAEDEAYITALARQAYYDTPAAALGMPEFTVSLYPEHGTQRIVEITLSYPEDTDVLRRKSEELTAAAAALAAQITAQQDTREGRLWLLFQMLPDQVRVLPADSDQASAGSTAWDALVGDGADSEGLALAFELLCDLLEIDCTVAEGTLDGVPHFWNVLSGGQSRNVDLSRGEYGSTYTDEQLVEMGYVWEGSPASAQSAQAN